MAEELEWMDPPAAPTRASSKVARAVQLLRANPGKWARISRENKSTNCQAPYKKAGGLETRCIRTNPGETPTKYDLYVRAIPKGEPRPKGLSDAYRAMGGPQPTQAARPTPGAYTAEGRQARGVPEGGLPPAILRR